MMAPRELSDIDIMERFISTTDDLGEIRVGNARIEEKVDGLIAAQSRCFDHATRIREVEANVGKLSQTFKVAAWVVTTAIAGVGVIAALAAFF